MVVRRLEGEVEFLFVFVFKMVEFSGRGCGRGFGRGCGRGYGGVVGGRVWVVLSCEFLNWEVRGVFCLSLVWNEVS